jgi:hypothetical protein
MVAGLRGGLLEEEPAAVVTEHEDAALDPHKAVGECVVRSGSVALLELLAGAAPAGIVAA